MDQMAICNVTIIRVTHFSNAMQNSGTKVTGKH